MRWARGVSQGWPGGVCWILWKWVGYASTHRNRPRK